MSALEFDAVSVSYGKSRVVTEFTDRVESGEWLGVIGPNGAGKSSLLRAVAGLKPAQPAPVQFVTGRGDLAALLQEATADITALTRAESVAKVKAATMAHWTGCMGCMANTTSLSVGT